MSGHWGAPLNHLGRDQIFLVLVEGGRQGDGVGVTWDVLKQRNFLQILRHESSMPTSQELSYLEKSVREGSVSPGQIHTFFNIIDAYMPDTDPVPSRINQYHLILTQDHQVPTIAVLY